MNKRTKLILFLSAYSPLFFIISVIYINIFIPNFNWNDLVSTMVSIFKVNLNWDNLIAFIFLFVMIIANLIFYLYYSQSGSHSKYPYKVKTVENKSADVLNYLIPFVIAILLTDVFKLSEIKGIISFFTMMIIVYSVYINSDLIYFNPLFLLFNIKFYKITDYNNNNLIVLTKKEENEIKEEKVIKLNRITQGLYKLE